MRRGSRWRTGRTASSRLSRLNLDKFLVAVKRGREKLHERSQETVVAGIGPEPITLAPLDAEELEQYPSIKRSGQRLARAARV